MELNYIWALVSGGYPAFKTDHYACCQLSLLPLKADLLMPRNSVTITVNT